MTLSNMYIHTPSKTTTATHGTTSRVWPRNTVRAARVAFARQALLALLFPNVAAIVVPVCDGGDDHNGDSDDVYDLGI